MIEKVRLKNFIGIKRGLGLDEIEVGFTGREGLIGLDGQNGAGKTTFMDGGLHPFALVPSREGSLSQHTFGRAAEKELIFTHNGNHYRTLIKIDSEGGRSEGFCWKNGESLLRGKISEYKDWSQREFGSPELFFSSIYSAQNGKKISDMTVGALKSLYVEFLRLERYEAWADTAKQAGNVLNGKLAGLDSRVASLSACADKKEQIWQECDTQAVSLGINSAEKEILQGKVTEKRHQLDTLKETISKNTLALERKRDLQAQIDRLEADLATEKEAAMAEINVLAEKWKLIKTQISNNETVLQDREKVEKAADIQRDLEDSLVILQPEIDRLTAEASEHQEKAHELELQVEGLKSQLKTLETDPENLRLAKIVEEAERAVKEKERELKTLDSDVDLATYLSELSALQKRADEGVKYMFSPGQPCDSSYCMAIAAAAEARGLIPVAQDKVSGRTKEIEHLKFLLSEENKSIKETTVETIAAKWERAAWVEQWNKDANEEIKDKTHALRNAQQVAQGNNELAAAKRQQIAKTRGEIALQKALADKLPEIQVAEARKTDLEKQLAEVTEQGQAKRTAWGDKEKSTGMLISVLQDDKDKLVIDYLAEESLVMVQTEINELTNLRIPQIEKEIQTSREKIATLQAELSRIEAAEKELEEVREARQALTVKISRWRYLQNACGKNGLQALEIDGAAPLISSRANELLYMGYGPQFSIRIDTQDEEGRESLDIIVISEHGEESIKLKSGGEKVWLLHPIRLAMTLLSKEKSGRAWDYAAFDEQDGALDVKGGATDNFMAMYRPFMQIGSLKQIFYISHKEVCLSYADHILSFQKGKNPAWS